MRLDRQHGDLLLTAALNSSTTLTRVVWLEGDGVDELPYVECSTADGQSQTQFCQDQGIGTYPTWEFEDGSRVTGVQTLQTLSTLSGVAIPENEVPYDKVVDLVMASL